MFRFVDESTVGVQAGQGGKGCRSFYQDLWTRHPLPDGGNGGRGGHVLFRANPQLTTLLDFQNQRFFRAGHGGHGSSKRKQGFQGTDRILEVPLGTVLWDAATGDLIRELLEPGQELIVVRGGAGGVGNGSAGKTNQSFRPEQLEGTAGEQRRIRLELKLLAEAGIVGLPNAGKSTLIRRISNARPKVAAYPFTTTNPVLGMVELSKGQSLVAVDVPGLIEGAHRGKGLGLAFLRHIERTKVLVHLIDMAGTEGRDPWADYGTLNAELEAYDPSVAAKPQIVVANKMDEPSAKEKLALFRRKVRHTILPISAKTGEGIPRLLKEIATALAKEISP